MFLQYEHRSCFVKKKHERCSFIFEGQEERDV